MSNVSFGVHSLNDFILTPKFQKVGLSPVERPGTKNTAYVLAP